MKSQSNFGRAKVFTFIAAIISVTLGFNACNSHNGNNTVLMQDSTSNIAPPVIDTMQLKADWEKFKADANNKLKESDDSIRAFKKRMVKFDKKLKVKYDKNISLMERRNDTLKTRLDNFKFEEKEKWADFKVKFKHDMDEVSNWLRDSTSVHK